MGTLILACGSLALFLVRLTSPRLEGTSWLAGAFASGAVGAALLLTSRSPLLWAICADLALLGSFLLVHVAVLRLTKRTEIPYLQGLALLGLQVIVDLLFWRDLLSQRDQLVIFGLVVAVITTASATVLWRGARAPARAPAIFSALLLSSLALFNIVRSACFAFAHSHRALNRDLTYAAFIFYLVVAMGIGFGALWLTTVTLTSELEHMASTDPLTRLYNRRVFLGWCERELLRSQRSEVPFSLLMLDLDHFKRVNDSFGHQVGDEMLCAAVEKMQHSVRGIDVLCRWGGEEFAVLLPNASVEATRIVAERIRQNVQTVPLPTLLGAAGPNELPRLSVSIGAATYRNPEDSISAMLRRADQAMYEAKHAGRNRVLVAS